tara:strand:+ start:10923 stop:12791 length:1869 start_codon:yes stop_codon:yes gene_type:complete
MSTIIERLTENIVSRDLQKEGAALLNKWESTGLLEGLGDDRHKNNMAVLLENQAKELLREASTMAAGDVQGFAAVAFPIVRRVFGGLIANDLVSVQPMSLPSGLIFFLDFTFGTADSAGGYPKDSSLYGGDAVGSQITGGVSLTVQDAVDFDELSFYSLNQGYSSTQQKAEDATLTLWASGTSDEMVTTNSPADSASQTRWQQLLQYDPDVSGSALMCVTTPMSTFSNLDEDNFISITLSGAASGIGSEVAAGTLAKVSSSENGICGTQVRRLTRRLSDLTGAESDRETIMLVYQSTASMTDGSWSRANVIQALATSVTGTWNDNFVFATDDSYGTVTGVPGAVVGSQFLLEGTLAATPAWADQRNDIPEIDIKVDSVAVTATTKKLKAKWSPELGQDLNAYHNLDAEVELTGILSEQVALEIDREIVNDLVKGATGGVLYWSRSPGLFVNRETGAEIGASALAPDFTGTVSEWYETLIETINDVSARIHRKTLRGGANFIVTSPEVASILEFTAGFRAQVSVDDNGMAGAVKVGNISKKWDVYIDPYFPRNLVLCGRKGNSFLESGYVYAPYVPLQVTPTIFGVEDFTPRKGVLTRYAKKMVRPDMYGVVVVRGLNGESGG